MGDQSDMDRTPCGRLCGHRSAPEYPGGSASVPRVGRRYRMVTVPYDRKRGRFDEEARDGRLIEIVSVDGIVDTCLGDELSFTGLDRATGERMRGSMMIGGWPAGSGFRAMYGARTIAEMSPVPAPAEDGGDAAPGGSAAADFPEIAADALPDVCLMAEGREYDLTVALPDGGRRVLRGASRHEPDRRCSAVDAAGCRMEFRIDLPPDDGSGLAAPGGCLHCRVEIRDPGGRDIRMTMGRDVLSDRDFEVVKVMPAGGDAARDAADLLNERLRDFARLRGILLELSGGRLADDGERKAGL